MKTVFFDLETKWLFSEKDMIKNEDKDPSRLGLAVAGILDGGKCYFYDESLIDCLVSDLKDCSLIVGYNLGYFDYGVLSAYVSDDVIKSFKVKTFDMFDDLRRITGDFIGLDDLCMRNVKMKKNFDTLKIPSMWRNGKKKEVKKYLGNDLMMTKKLYEFGKIRKKVKYMKKNYGIDVGVKEVLVDWK